ncbi:cupin domain-containing protein [Microbacteriaceae bacterium 4G12]
MGQIKDAQYWISQLGLLAHPEGGYYKQTYQSEESITSKELSVTYEGNRTLSTSIYFLLTNDHVSHFHRLKSDEIWYFHDGSPLTVHVIHENGQYEQMKLGLEIENGEKPQVIVPKNSIFGSTVDLPNSYALVGCMVSPGFDFVDFELFQREELLSQYPQYKEIITKLTME